MNDSETKIACHEGEPFSTIKPIQWEVRPGYSPYHHCSYCGSLHSEDVKKILGEGGRLGGADWKYGWAHKFYVYPKSGGGMFKWYNTHLNDLNESFFQEFAALLKTHAGIEFVKEDGTLVSYAPYYGYQRG